MRIYVVFVHPSHESFTYAVLGEFLHGLADAGHTVEVGDLYAMGFKTDMCLDEYTREMGLQLEKPVPADVQAEQAKINRADALAFVYPLWWSDCPAKLKGWFDRVWTYGYAYFYEEVGAHATSEIKLKKALAICAAGHTVEKLEVDGIAGAMRAVMINDRLLGVGVEAAELAILGGMVGNPPDARARNLEAAYRLGLEF
jgi:NAD(P)H dehydrogenase (quinone)